MPLEPFDDLPIDPAIAALPKADLHVHQEEVARLGRVMASRERRRPSDNRPWLRRLLAETPPGMGRIDGVYATDGHVNLDGVPTDQPETIVAMIADVLAESAADGSVLVEMRFSVTGMALLRPGFMALFREAERQVQARYPRLCAEAIAYLNLVDDPRHLQIRQHQLESCLLLARQGLAGMDFRVDPYDTQASQGLWATAYRWAERAAVAGLGITLHAGEFSTANLAAALRTPSLRRLGHGVHAVDDPRLLDDLARSGVTVESSLTCNVVLGAVPSYESHPIRQFVARGIPVALATDLPAHICTTIGREYAIAAALGFTPRELAEFTRNAIRASFTSASRRRLLLDVSASASSL